MSNLKKKVVIRLVTALAILAFIFGMTIRLLKINGSIISGCFYYAILLFMITYTVKRVEKENFENIGLDFKNISKKIVLGIAVFAILSLFQVFFLVTEPNFFIPHLTLPQIILNTAYYIFIVGFTEELIFRGYLLTKMTECLHSKFFSVILSSIIFALWHFPVSYYWGQVIFTFFFGLVLSTFKVKVKGNIIISLALAHGLYNSMLLWIGYFI